MAEDEAMRDSTGGWIKAHRSVLDAAWYRKSDYVHLWLHLLLKANHAPKKWFYKNCSYEVKRGQFITSRQSLSTETGIEVSKVERILKCFENEQQIEQQNLYTSRLISIVNYEKYQQNEQQNEQQVNSERTASEQQVNTNKKDKNLRIKEYSTSPNGEVGNALKTEYEKINKSDAKAIRGFIKNNRPVFAEPYVDFWNLFAGKYGLAAVQQITDTRKRKLRVRVANDSFDFCGALLAATEQKFALESNWFTFDFMIENDTNYVKVLEKKYLKKQAETKTEETLPQPETNG